MSIDIFHHLDEFLKGDLSISVVVDLLDNGVKGCFVKLVGATKREDFLNFIGGNHTRAVFVKHLERGLQFFVCSKLVFVQGGNDKLRVVNETTLVGIDCVEHLFDFLVGHNLAVVFKIAFLNFLHGKFAISILVERLEDFGKTIAFSFGKELTRNKCKSCLLHSSVCFERFEVV